mmetsp:Transcript_11309/g.18415  ORF Transcript_11309/g.18415 Transcript_11309/m.18415 type:complete len:280 (-) Transcript_11309:75-914(-)|eukprot:CAMPEP_0114431086 /NCGR_PEP_ID=MMETSP0103-20121206/10405_1 /TAXON_ID=37642 ORGANISM="Paraphysomonas imperforata, Strain PA2" /NCGR_SAMPLE_ID=MMETSP0103 /ASSEMBLY_ACC=CAM_ASM_000201 /LENGTH=279 /DNA_ID=CAMNT_0001600613 /DNA_START=23 /DNA_END=862 /DNA_ORIENTATION=-
MRRSLLLCRGAKGRGWYKRYMEMGEVGFQKNLPPAPFDWSKGLPNAVSNMVVFSDDAQENACSNSAGPPAPNRPKVFFDITIEEDRLGRLVVELAHDVVPRTSENFMRLCEGSQQFSYKGTKVCDILKESSVRLGDVETNTGAMSHSSTGERYFRDENFIIPHSGAGLLSMATSGVHTNGSQFYISLGACPHFNGRCVAFGRVLEGDKVIKEMEKVYTFRGTPARDIVIEDCGVLDYAGVELTQQPLSKVAVTEPTHHLPLHRTSSSASAAQLQADSTS